MKGDERPVESKMPSPEKVLVVDYAAFSIALMHSNTVALFDIAVIRASWSSLLFFMRDPANKTCITFFPESVYRKTLNMLLSMLSFSIMYYMVLKLEKVPVALPEFQVYIEKVKIEDLASNACQLLTAHLVRFCCWSLLSSGLLLFINLCIKCKIHIDFQFAYSIPTKMFASAEGWWQTWRVKRSADWPTTLSYCRPSAASPAIATTANLRKCNTAQSLHSTSKISTQCDQLW